MPIAELSDTRLFYVEVGDGHPCLVIPGGLGIDHSYLRPWLDPLGDVLRLVYYDHRGNGRSGRPSPDSLTHAQLAADADVLRTHVGYDQIAVIGHSFGGFIALEYALRYPSRLSHLILIDTAPAFRHLEEIVARAASNGATVDALLALCSPKPSDDAEFERAVRLIAPLYFHRPDATLAERILERTIFSGSAAARGDMLALTFDVTPRLGEIGAPTLVLVGEGDCICPPSQAAVLRDGIPRCELVVFDNSGHLPFVEQPERFLTVVHEWLERTT